MNELENKCALVTGASKGIGEATARVLAANKVKVLLAARSGKAIERIAGEISEAGGIADSIVCDVSQYHDVAAAVRRCVSVFGRIDILVNNAGVIEPISRLTDSDPDAWCHAADINYKGVFFGLHTAIPKMLEQNGGVIVNISSGAAVSALEGWSHYCSSKAAVLSLTKCVHKEYGHLGIRVVGLSPGTVATNMQIEIKQSGLNPVSQLDPSVHISADDAARAVAWLCKEEAKDLDGGDFSLRGTEARERVGLD